MIILKKIWIFLNDLKSIISFEIPSLNTDDINTSKWVTYMHIWEWNYNNKIIEFNRYMMIVFQHLYIPLDLTKPPLQELPLQQVFSTCKQKSELQLQFLIGEDSRINVPNLLESQIQNVYDFYEKNELNEEILNSLHEVLLNKINYPIHIFFWNKQTLKPMIKFKGILYDHTHEQFTSIQWKEKDAIFLVNSGDSEFNKFTLYEAIN